MSTTEKLQKKLEKLENEVNGLRQDQKRIESEMAEKWEDDTSALQNDYAKNNARINALEMARPKLMGDIETEKKAGLVDEWEAILAKIPAAQDLESKTLDVLERLNKDIIEAKINQMDAYSGLQEAQHYPQRWLITQIQQYNLTDLSEFLVIAKKYGLDGMVQNLARSHCA